MSEVQLSAYGYMSRVSESLGVVFGGLEGKARLVEISGNPSMANALKITKESEVGVFSKLSEFKSETPENQLTLISYVYSQLGLGNPDEVFIKRIQKALFGNTEEVTVGLDGPMLKYADVVLQLNAEGALELYCKGTPIAKDNKNIYNIIANFRDKYTLGVEYVRNFLLLMIDKVDMMSLLTREDLIYKFVDFLTLVSKDAGDTAIEQAFTEKILKNKKPSDIKVSCSGNQLKIDNNGLVFVVEGGDGLGFSIDGNTINVTTGMKKSMNAAHSVKEASNVVGAHMYKLFSDCGKSAKELYIAKVKPAMGKFTNYVVNGDYEYDETESTHKGSFANRKSTPIEDMTPEEQAREEERNRQRAEWERERQFEREQEQREKERERFERRQQKRERRGYRDNYRDDYRGGYRDGYRDDYGYNDRYAPIGLGRMQPWLIKGGIVLLVIIFILLFMAAC